MKKNLISLAVAGALLATASVASAATPDTFYIGGGLGYAHMDWNHSDNAGLKSGDTSGIGAHIFGGYSFNEYFSLEGTYRFLGDFDGVEQYPDPNVNARTTNFDVHGPEVSALLSFPITSSGTDIFLRGGVMYAFASHSSDRVVPVVGAGANIGLTDSLALRLGYDRFFNVYDDGSETDITYNTDFDIDYAYISLKYSFLKPAPAPVEPITQTVTTTYTLDANTTFGFDSDKVSEQGASAISQVLVESQNANLQFVKYSVVGHSDRVGRAEYNQKLSERRAQAVANELVARGVSAGDITATGVGSSESVVGNACDGLAGKELIKCLGPDRRVVINVTGTTTKTETISQE